MDVSCLLSHGRPARQCMSAIDALSAAHSHFLDASSYRQHMQFMQFTCAAFGCRLCRGRLHQVCNDRPDPFRLLRGEALVQPTTHSAEGCSAGLGCKAVLQAALHHAAPCCTRTLLRGR